MTVDGEEIAPLLMVGAVVYLNSGSPPLTVVETHLGDLVEVEWFVDGGVQRAVFPDVCLTTANPLSEASQ